MKTLSENDLQNTKNLIAILDSLKSPIILLNTAFQVIGFNSAFASLMGLSSEVSNTEISLAELVQDPEIEDFARGTTQLSEWKYAERVFKPLIEAAPHGWTLELQDVTHYTRLNHNQSESMRFVLHDLRSPLTAIQGFAGLMESVGELNDKQKYFVTKVLSGVAQMTALVENVQDAGRYDPESGTYQVMRIPTDLGQIARKIVDNHLVPAEKTLQVNLKVDEQLPIINADETMLQRAMTNLVDNAIKYTPDGGNIHVSVVRHENLIIIAVQDSGLGISPQNQAQLFERHSRIHRPEFKRIKGTGLGLFIVRSVARRHGGNAWVESEEGKGSTFYISIPLEGANLFSAAD